MLKIENVEVFGWEAAIRGARNPMNSWAKSDSHGTSVGENDLSLMHKLSVAGPDHGKFLRFINVTMDITAPLYWWKEFDTYKVGTVANSCSTMHKIHAKEFEVDDFSHEHLSNSGLLLLRMTVDLLNDARVGYNNCTPTGEASADLKKFYWWQMIQLLPSSYNQRRTVQLNYAVLKNIYHARKSHKLTEWHTFCDTICELPYAKELIICGTTDG